MKKFVFFSILFLLSASFTSALGANPAAEHCISLNYEYKIVNTELGQQGICIFPDQTECEEWAFLEGRCGNEYSYCAKNGYELVVRDDGQNPFSKEYYVCTENGTELAPVNELMGLSIIRRKLNETYDEWWRSNHTQDLGNPDFFDWTHYKNKNWLTPVKDQGNCGGCWAYASVAVVEASYKINKEKELDLSEAYLIYGCSNLTPENGCEGGESLSALRLIRDKGIPDEACFPFGQNNCSEICPDWQNRTVKINEMNNSWIGNRVYPEEIKKILIEKGPLVSSMWLGAGGYWDDDIYKCKNPIAAMHAVVIVGYNDTGEYWVIKNSYGTGFGENGYFKVGYGECFIDSGFKIYSVDLKKESSFNLWNWLTEYMKKIFRK